MKKVLAMLLLCANCFAGGKILIEPAYHYPSHTIEPQLGFDIYQHLVGPLAVSAWAGTGWHSTATETIFWVGNKYELSLLFDKVEIRPGVTLRYANSRDKYLADFNSDSDVHVSVIYQLW